MVRLEFVEIKKIPKKGRDRKAEAALKVSEKDNTFAGFEHRFDLVAGNPAGYSFRNPPGPVQPVNLVLTLEPIQAPRVTSERSVPEAWLELPASCSWALSVSICARSALTPSDAGSSGLLEEEVLEPLKIHYNGSMKDMPYDERYTEFIQPTGLLPFITLGEALCMNITSDGWRQKMEGLIGMAPPEQENKKDRAPAGSNFFWIRTNFGQCPEGADRDTVKTYTRVYLWYVISRTLFADSGGKLAHWCWLKALTKLEHKWSWGTTALAYLYRQVDWEPYGSFGHIGSGMSDLNPKCLEEADYWRMRFPLICMWLVEYHQPHRVMRQFGLYQESLPQWQDTDRALHRLDRQQQRKITKWPDHHRNHVTAFAHCLDVVRNGGHVVVKPYDPKAFNNYLHWFFRSTRIELVNHAYEEELLEEPIMFDEVAQSQYDRIV
ncbi:hypothetical protein QYE76_049872 [Lolium multiflorum]|uniref:Aminotransferase-like plant mobile domain-containing protein n=1 Tax=Lolium multiflorum TaxID=4521 RepID=A0AAD8SQX9_LOLMU|nr:hypothetical protein QYE76_049872 [Lolium multiflorum]